jgi:hypothetical protein
MPASSAAPSGYQLNGLIERVTFFSEESGFCVLRVKAEGYRDLVTVVGSAPSVSGESGLRRKAIGLSTRNTVVSSKRFT